MPKPPEPRFKVPHRHRLLREVKELTAEDWAFIWIAYQGFLAQVNLIVQRARDRAKEQAANVERSELPNCQPPSKG